MAAASLVGPAGAVPTGLTGVVALAVSAIVGVLGADKSSFLQPKSKTQTLTVQNRAIDFFMVIPVKFDKCFVTLINTYHPSRIIQTLSDNGAFVRRLFVCQRLNVGRAVFQGLVLHPKRSHRFCIGAVHAQEWPFFVFAGKFFSRYQNAFNGQFDTADVQRDAALQQHAAHLAEDF